MQVILFRKVKFLLNIHDDTGMLFDKLSEVGSDLLKETLPSIISGTNNRIKQDESLVTFARNISREQERIDWEQICNTSSQSNSWTCIHGLLLIQLWKSKQ